jgi:ABC-type glycerol-3-phosphate transport system permease component
MSDIRKNWWAYLCISAFIFAFNIPILLTIFNSFKTNQQIITQPPPWIFQPIIEHYANIFSDANFPVWFYLKNSIVTSVFGTILTIVIAFPAAYTMASLRCAKVLKYVLMLEVKSGREILVF